MIHKSRNGFSLLMALAVIVIMSVVAAMVMNVSNKTIIETTTQYQREQAAILAKSYTEFAIMAISGHDRNAGCLNQFNGGLNTLANANVGNGFRVNVDIAYIVDNVSVQLGVGCHATSILYGTAGENITTPQTPLNVIIDVYVRYKDLDHRLGAGSPWHTYHRRTLQQI